MCWRGAGRRTPTCTVEGQKLAVLGGCLCTAGVLGLVSGFQGVPSAWVMVALAASAAACRCLPGRRRTSRAGALLPLPCPHPLRRPPCSLTLVQLPALLLAAPASWCADGEEQISGQPEGLPKSRSLTRKPTPYIGAIQDAEPEAEGEWRLLG